MNIIRQTSLFGIQELYEMELIHRYEAIISAIDLDVIYHEITKKSRLDAPEGLNHVAMIISIFIRSVERIPTIKDLIKRLNDDFASSNSLLSKSPTEKIDTMTISPQ